LLKIVIILVLIAGAIFAAIAICAYVLKVDFAVNIMNTITEPFSGALTGGNLDLPTIASGASVATAATTAIGWIKSNKDKALALKDNAKQQLENSGLLEQVESIKETKTQLEEQITELTQTKDKALAEAKEAKQQLTQQTEELQKARSTIETLHETLRRNKLTDEESIIKTVVK
jgi:hypothetical protein